MPPSGTKATYYHQINPQQQPPPGELALYWTRAVHGPSVKWTSAMTDVVFLHVGLFKSGTTYLQNVLWASRGALADEGILVPGRHSGGAAFAAVDVMGVPRVRRAEASYGSWARFVGWIRGWDGARAVLSAERLTFAGPDTIRRVLADLAPVSVHVVVTVRDLERVVPASWQERVRNRKTVTWPDFLAAVTDPARAGKAPAKDFWRQQDAPALLADWVAQVPVKNVCVVTVPPPGSDPHLLPARFAEAIGSDVSLWTTEIDTAHAALGVTEVEMLRRLNPRLPEQVTMPVYNHVVKLGLARHALAVRQGQRQVRMPGEYAPWLEKQAQRIIEGLREPGYRVVGDLEDLMPTARSGQRPDDLSVSDSDLLDASLDVSGYLLIRLTEQDANPDQATDQADLVGLPLPSEYRDWLEQHAPRTIDRLRTHGHVVVADTESLSPTSRSSQRSGAVTRSHNEPLDTSLDINAYLVTRLAESRPSRTR